MRGDFQFLKDNYPFRVDGGIVRSKDLFLVIDQRTQDVLLETFDGAEAARKHGELKDTYYSRQTGQAALTQQDRENTNRARRLCRDQSEDRSTPTELAHGAVL